MSMKLLRSQLAEMDFPNLCRFALTQEEHPRYITLSDDGMEYAVTIHETHGGQPRLYYHGSRRDCTEAYKSLLSLFAAA